MWSNRNLESEICWSSQKHSLWCLVSSINCWWNSAFLNEAKSWFEKFAGIQFSNSYCEVTKDTLIHSTVSHVMMQLHLLLLHQNWTKTANWMMMMMTHSHLTCNSGFFDHNFIITFFRVIIVKSKQCTLRIEMIQFSQNTEILKKEIF